MRHLSEQHWQVLRVSARILVTLALLFVFVEGVLMRLTVF